MIPPSKNLTIDCSVCKKDVVEQGISCNFCDKWIHLECLKLPARGATKVLLHQGIYFFCVMCKPIIDNLIVLDKLRDINSTPTSAILKRNRSHSETSASPMLKNKSVIKNSITKISTPPLSTKNRFQIFDNISVNNKDSVQGNESVQTPQQGTYNVQNNVVQNKNLKPKNKAKK